MPPAGPGSSLARNRRTRSSRRLPSSRSQPRDASHEPFGRLPRLPSSPRRQESYRLAVQERPAAATSTAAGAKLGFPRSCSGRLPRAFQAAPDPSLPLPAGSHFRQATAELAEGRRAGNSRTRRSRAGPRRAHWRLSGRHRRPASPRGSPEPGLRSDTSRLWGAPRTRAGAQARRSGRRAGPGNSPASPMQGNSPARRPEKAPGQTPEPQ